MNYAGKAEQLLLGGQGQTEIPYSTEEQRLAAAQVLALLTLAEAIQGPGAFIDMGLRGDGGASAATARPSSAQPALHEQDDIVNQTVLHPVDHDGVHLRREPGQDETAEVLLIDHIVPGHHPAGNLHSQLRAVAKQRPVPPAHRLRPIHQHIAVKIPDLDICGVTPQKALQITIAGGSKLPVHHRSCIRHIPLPAVQRPPPGTVHRLTDRRPPLPVTIAGNNPASLGSRPANGAPGLAGLNIVHFRAGALRALQADSR